MSGKNKTLPVPHELEGAATVKDVSVLEGRVEKCYSAERYEDFQAAVEKIIGRYVKQVLIWGALVWIVSLIGSMLVQKFLHPF